jgi:uroporphyrinogen III methyltransferase/synthase
MVEAATAGLTVVRLKGGDPHLFGRLNEEMQCLVDAGIPFQVVPGVTSASAAAQAAGISLTDRQHSSAVAFITGHLSHEHDPALPALDFGQFADFPGTLVFYMGVRTIELWSEALLNNGKPSQTPVVIVYHASWSDQQIFQTTLGESAAVVKQKNLQSPCMIIVGDTITAGR